jgi:hypothetical protein
MMQTQRSEYLYFRRKFEPTSVKLVIIAESPPASGNYFYNPTGTVSEHLFSTLMQQLGFTPTSKESGLREFQKSGWVLLDATYEPVNELDDRSADRVIIRDYHLLRDDLAALLSDRSAPIILMKANVCRLLEPKLAEDGFNVLNHGRAVYFPNNGRQPDFKRQFSAILKSSTKLTDGSSTPAPRHASRPRRKKRPATEIGKATFTDYIKEAGKIFLTAFIEELPNAARNAFKRDEIVGANETPDMPGLALHEAMQEVLAEKDCRSATEIASEINRRGLYFQRDGGQVPASQISARANNHPDKFVRAGDKICLA